MSTHHQVGSALITVLIISVAIAGIMMALVDTSASHLAREQRQEQRLRRQVSAESAANIVLLSVLQAQSSPAPSTAIPLSSTSRTAMPVDLAGSNSAALMIAYKLDATVDSSNLPSSLKMERSNGTLTASGSKLTATIYPLPWDFTTNACTAAGTISSWLIKAQAQDGAASNAIGYERQRVEIRLTLVPTTISGKGLFSATNFEFKGSASTDSWNSGRAAYNSATPGSNGNIYAISGLPLISNAGVNGNAYQTSDPMPVVVIPSPIPGIALPASVTTGSGRSAVTSKTLIGGTTYSCVGNLPDVSYIIGSGSDVILYVSGDINISNAITFIDTRKSSAVVPGNRLWIYQSDFGAATTSLNGNAVSGNAADPGRVIIESAFSGEITFNGSASLGAVLIAPNAIMKLRGNFDFFGCMWVKEMYQDQVSGNFSFHYDDYLDNLQFSNTPTYAVSGWRSYAPAWNQ